MSPSRRSAAPLLAVAALLAALFTLTACGHDSEHKEVVEGEPVELGELQYNVIFSRFLNPADNEDSAYLVGQAPPPAGSTYFGIFFEVQNESDESQQLPASLKITDADHTEFEAIPSESLYAFPLGGEIEAEEQVPVLDSTPQTGPLEGSIVLFELPASASEARPLTLHIPGPEGPAEVDLDL